MAKSPTSKNPAIPRDDDLTTIKGIGSARQQWLRESFNIRTFQDLAALSVDEIDSRLKAEGQIASRSKIAQWIAQAQGLAAIEPAPQTRMRPAGSKVTVINTPPGEKGDGWRPFASFVVEFQTRQVEGRATEQRTTVHYMEGDRGETWPGIKSRQLGQWMLDQIGDRSLPKTEPDKVPSGTAYPATAPPVTVQIAQAQAFQPPQAETPTALGKAGRPFLGFVRSSEPFALKVLFGLGGHAAINVTQKQITYRAQFHAYDLSTGKRTRLGDSEPDTLIEGELSYSATLPEITLQPGMYRLQILTTLEDRPPIMGSLEVPLLQVV
jgi:hypothetical protein